MMNRKTRPLISGAAIVAVLALALTPMAASAATDDSEAEIIEDFNAVADEPLLDELADTPESGGILTPAEGSVSLAAQSSNVVAVPSIDGDAGVMISRIEQTTAETATSFALEIPAGASATLNETNDVVSFFAEDGSPLGSSQTLWAKDADGNDLSTHLSLDGTTLTQVVDVPPSADVAYPIVAVAAASPNYYSSAFVTSQPGVYVVHAVPTFEGRRDSGAIYLATHTQQLKNKLGSNASKVTGTIENQFHCRVVFNSFMGSGNTAYDMESNRPNVSYLVAWASQCNP